MIIKIKNNAVVTDFPFSTNRLFYAESVLKIDEVEWIKVLTWDDKGEYFLEKSQVEILPERLVIIAHVLSWSDVPSSCATVPHILFQRLPSGTAVLTKFGQEVRNEYKETIDQIIRDVHHTTLFHPDDKYLHLCTNQHG